jgi:hypothetical protein
MWRLGAMPRPTVVIECRIASDFADRERLEPLLKLREHLETVREGIELQRIRQEEPQLRRAGTSLFAELEEWDFAASRLPAYHKVLRRLRKLDEQIHGQTKFFVIARYQLADRLYVAAPRGMIRPCEWPRGWGLLECPLRCLEKTSMEERFDGRRAVCEGDAMEPDAGGFRSACCATLRCRQRWRQSRGEPVSC